MSELNPEDIRAIHETHDEVIKIKAVLGDSTSGLCYDIKCLKGRVNRLELIIVSIISAGGLGGGIFGVIKFLAGS